MNTDRHADGRVLSLYTGQKRPALINGRSEQSAYVRTPCPESLNLGRSGFSGNEMAVGRRLGIDNHAVYLFHHDHYRYFEEVLGRPIAPGSFAENITYAGPKEDELRIGDRLRIGEAVVELTSPRVPCYKLAHFLGADTGFPSQFSASGRTGVYARVIKPGKVSPGSALVVVHSDSRNAPMVDLSEVLTGGRPANDLISRVKSSPALLPGLHELIDERLNLLSLNGTEPRQVRIIERVQESPDVVSLAFDMPSLPGAKPRAGQFVTFGLEDDSGQQHFRCYSLTDGPFSAGDNAAWRIAVKRDVASANAFSVSSWIHERIGAGAVCTIYPPAGDFALPDNPSGPLTFIAGGIGITPILAQIRALAAIEYADPISLIYVARTVQDLVFTDALAECGDALKQFDMRFFATKEMGVPAGQSETIRSGRPDLSREIGESAENVHLFVCGPVSMIEEVRSIHSGLGRPNDHLHFELFSDSLAAGEPIPSAEQAEIALMPDGIRGSWRQGDGSLLNWIEGNTDYRPPAACRSGICRTCRASLVRGRVVYPPTVTPPAATEVLLCCGLPASDIEIGLTGNLVNAVAE